MKLNCVKEEPPKDHAKRLQLTSQRFSYSTMSESAESEINYTKRKDRTYLQRMEWNRDRYYQTDATKQLFQCPDQIERVDCSQLSVEDFIERYEKPAKPVIIRGITADWHPQKYWSLQAFYDRYKDVSFKVGEDDEGRKIRIRLKYYLEYLVHNTDDSPLYLFESSLESNEDTKPIINHYTVPKYFRDDLFALAGERKRPPYRWLLIGPQRSGTTVHVDPLYTSAWNTSLCGHKRWVLFPESVPKGIVKGYQYRRADAQDEAIQYFTDVLPNILANQPAHLLGALQFIQYPGETVFVPGGWWHAVLNLDDTFAVTQNVMTHINFERVWISLRRERPKFARYFLERLRLKVRGHLEQEPNLYERAQFMNLRDGWKMGERRQRKASLSYESGTSSSSSSSESEGESSTNERSRSRSRRHKK